MKFKNFIKEKSFVDVLPYLKWVVIVGLFVSSCLELFSMNDLIIQYQVNYPDIFEDCSYYGFLLPIFGFCFFSLVFNLPDFFMSLKKINQDKSGGQA